MTAIHTHRRRFLQDNAISLSALTVALSAEPWRPLQAGTANRPVGREYQADIAIIGAGVGGFAAALAGLEAGRTVVMTEETDWIGGQLTSQAVPPDENPWIETFGANRSYQEFRRLIRNYYRENYPLTDEARRDPLLNPGNGSVSRLCHEPRVALAVMTNLLARYLSTGQLIVLTDHVPISAEVAADTIKSVTVKDLRTGESRTILAPVFIDATELGDLAELAQVEHVTGFESRAETAEPRAPDQPQPLNQQAFTICFAIDHRPGEDHTIEKPQEYAKWSDYVPPLKPAWPGKLLSLTYSNPYTLEPKTLGFDPTKPDQAGWWKYRRIIDASKFASGTYPTSGVCLVNWPQNDYLPGTLIGPGVTAEMARKHLASARQLSLSLFYWLQTEAPRPDGGTGWKGLKLRGDLLGTNDGLAKSAYIRESRRLKTRFTVTSKHVGTEDRLAEIGKTSGPVKASVFADSVGIGAYRIDLHPSTGGDNYIDLSSLPFQIPLGSLIPIRLKNLIPACKNLGVTHLTNGCYRLHPVEWAIGEAAGSLAAFSVSQKLGIHEVYENPKQRASYLSRLEARGVSRVWAEIKPL